MLRIGFSEHQPRRLAVLNTLLSATRAFLRWLGVVYALSSHAAHSSLRMLRTRRNFTCGHSRISRLIACRKSLCVRARLSFFSSAAASTACAKLTVRRLRFISCSPSSRQRSARRNLPPPRFSPSCTKCITSCACTLMDLIMIMSARSSSVMFLLSSFICSPFSFALRFSNTHVNTYFSRNERFFSMIEIGIQDVSCLLRMIPW